MLNFIALALVGGIFISIITAILGNFMLWKRISYLGDAIGHSSLLGIAIGVIFNKISVIWILLVCVAFSTLLVLLKKIYTFTFEALIVFNIQLFISVGLIILGWFYVSNGSPILSYMFGDILLMTFKDILIMDILAVVVTIYTIVFWKSLLITSINEDIAYAENIKVILSEIIFMTLIALSVAFLIKFVGVLLVPSLLIIPALISNYTARSPIMCFVISFICTYLAIVCGLLLSFIIDIPVTPFITFIIALEFFVVIIIKFIFSLLNK